MSAVKANDAYVVQQDVLVLVIMPKSFCFRVVDLIEIQEPTIPGTEDSEGDFY
jgi:hypothetical protein